MLTKILISCALFVAAQSAYAPITYGSPKSTIAGYAAQLQPAVSVSVLPSYRKSYGAVPAYGPAPAYAAPAPAPIYAAAPISYGSSAAGVDAEALNLAKLVFLLPSPGGPNPAIIDIPQYSTTSYTAPAVAISPKKGYGNALSGASAAAAASNVKLASSGYGPVPAPSVPYGPAPAPIVY